MKIFKYSSYVFLGKTNNIDYYAAALYQVLKDYNDEKTIKVTVDSYNHELRKALFKKGVVLPNGVALEEDLPGVNLILLPKLNEELKKRLKESVQAVKFTRMAIEVFEESSQGVK